MTRPPSGSLLILNKAEMAVLLRTFRGEGGAQSFFGVLWEQLDAASGHIFLTDAQIGRVFRYARHARGDGGYEGRLRRAFGRHFAFANQDNQGPALPWGQGV